MSELSEFRQMKDEFFKNDLQSPLTAEQKKTFKGLNYFAENEALHFELPLEGYADPQRVQMQTNRGDIRDYVKVGQIRFTVNGEEATLQVYEDEDNPGSYFVPFVDATAPAESYGAGRYLEPEPIGTDKLLVDFNVAYNPYCAFDPQKWSCPLPPVENRLKVRIEAGEKNFDPH